MCCSMIFVSKKEGDFVLDVEVKRCHSRTLAPNARLSFCRYFSGEGIVVLYAMPNPFLLNKICLKPMLD